MSTFTVIMLAIVAYFVIGGFVMGLIDDTAITEDVWFWPAHVISWFTELAIDLGYGLRDAVDTRNITQLEDYEE